MCGYVELTKRAGGDHDICSGLFDLGIPVVCQSCRLIRNPGLHAAARTAAVRWHLHQIHHLPDQLAGLVADSLPPQKVAGIMVCGLDRELCRGFDTVLRQELVDVNHLERGFVIVLKRGAAAGAHGQHRIDTPRLEDLDVLLLEVVDEGDLART